MHYPIAYRGDPAVPIWPLATFSGSTVIPIMPLEKAHFESFHEFRISEIPQMVSFSEDTGKIQFVLMRKPTDYYKLDFLEPIFKRLNPPQFLGLPFDQFGNSDEYYLYYKEFTALANSGLRDHLRKVSSVGSSKIAFQTLMTNFRYGYMMIRAISSLDFSNEFANFISSDFENGGKLLEVIDQLVLHPLRNPLKCMNGYSLQTLAVGRQLGLDIALKTKTVFPCEIGRLLLQKITCYPESLEACKQVTARYTDEDVIALFQAINEGISKNDPKIVEKTEKELSVALDNVWNDKKLLTKINGVRFGVPLLLGAIGAVAGGLAGGYTGILSGLGFDAVDKLFEFRDDAFSEKTMKMLSPSYQAVIFDFKKKYYLK